MKLLDLEHPSFKPLWVRVAVVAVCVLWGLFELAQGNTLWAVIFLGLGAVCGYRFAVIDYTAIPDRDKSISDEKQD
jgi:hypothetical protein